MSFRLVSSLQQLILILLHLYARSFRLVSSLQQLILYLLKTFVIIVFFKTLSEGEAEATRRTPGQSNPLLGEGSEHRQPIPRSSTSHGGRKSHGPTSTSTQHWSPEETQ